MSNVVSFPGLGLEFTVSRVAFTIFGMNVYWYGVIIASGLLLAIMLSFAKAKQFGINSDRMTDVILVTTVLAVICARLYYVVFAPQKYTSLAEIVNLRDGGLAIYGGILGAFGFGTLMCRARRVPTIALFDLASMGFLLGQGIGRWGNFTNQEAFGTNTTLPWGMISDNTRSYLAGMQSTLAAQGITVDPSLPVHPTFLYESIWCLAGLVLLLCYVKKRKFDGEILLMYIMWYGFERCIVEGLRTDSLMLGGIRVSQWLAGLSVVAALAVWLFCRRRALQKRAAGLPTLAFEREALAAQALARYEKADKAYRSREEAAEAKKNAAEQEKSNG